MLNNSIESRKDLKAWRYLPESLLDSKSNVDYRLVSCTLAGAAPPFLPLLPLCRELENEHKWRLAPNGPGVPSVFFLCLSLLCHLQLPQGTPNTGWGMMGGTRHFLPLPPLCDGTERHFDCHSLSACLFYEGRFQQLPTHPPATTNVGGTKGFGARTHREGAPKKHKKTEQRRRKNKFLPKSFCLSSFSPFSPASNAPFGFVI